MAKSNVKIKWRQPRFMKKTFQQVERGVENACLFGVAEMKKNLNRGNADGTNPSQPGEYPKKVTGTLQNNVAYEVKLENKQIRGMLGVRQSPATKYARALEQGTSKMAPRPFARRTIFENRAEIRKRIGKG